MDFDSDPGEQMKPSKQISESLRLNAILTFSGGFMDAYSYMCRGEVFANAQTGNVILLMIHASMADFSIAIKYVFPIAAFSLGVIVAEVIRHYFFRENRFHWRQLAVLLEALILFAVAFIPQVRNDVANALISFACGVQVESFRKLRGNAIATTMCVGNLRSAAQAMSLFKLTGEKDYFKKGMLYYSVIFIFALGAVVGNFCVKHMEEKAIFVSSLVVFSGFLLMFIEPKDKKEEDESQGGMIG